MAIRIRMRIRAICFAFGILFCGQALAQSNANGPSSATLPPITPQVCGPSASTCALKTSGGGNLYGAYAQASSSVYLFIFNSTSAPTNGSTTSGTASGNLVDCIGPSTQPSITYAPGPPEVFSAGMYAALSSTACGTLTLTTGTIHGSVQ